MKKTQDGKNPRWKKPKMEKTQDGKNPRWNQKIERVSNN